MYLFSLITIIISILSYLFCIYFCNASFLSKHVKKNKHCNNHHIVKLNKNCNDMLFKPKYLLCANNIDLVEMNINTYIENDKLSKIDTTCDVSSNITKIFINNKLKLSSLEKYISNIDFFKSNFLNSICEYSHSINILLKFYNNKNTEYILFCVNNNNIIKINNTIIYDKIIKHISKSELFIINNVNELYISNGFSINFNINTNIIKCIFHNHLDNKYLNQINKFNNLMFIAWISSKYCN